MSDYQLARAKLDELQRLTDGAIPVMMKLIQEIDVALGIPPAPAPAANPIDLFEPYSQNDPIWKNDHLGFANAASNSTLGAYGCAVTAIANLLKWTGHDKTPRQVNLNLINSDGFLSTPTYNLVRWLWLPQVYPFLSAYNRLDFPSSNPTAVQMDDLRATLKRVPVILKVDGILTNTGYDEHFVLAIGFNATGAIMIADSWDGHIKPLTAYTPASYAKPDKEAKAIYAMLRYEVAAA